MDILDELLTPINFELPFNEIFQVLFQNYINPIEYNQKDKNPYQRDKDSSVTVEEA